ncbi:peptidase S74 [Bacillus cereus]|uniref:phage tail spike protein n=1 Tax=Bacillus cereus group TaxID=86661 RepID=UPI000BF2B7C7|nr:MULTISPECIES: phage tail spike protein [Bacillus cereus group]PFN37234.1 peptidase S74 [Bacillus cereus]MCU5205665.1 tail fiber domain-containing protein [Bacillus paranthracis]MDA2160979.1 tail fiber domain-containing protein [Bacillus cereus group sp. Bc252]MDF9509553.1 phage tail spike protein [Bacillus paranthracis]MDF9669119.1 phage tail spike protein [Bacillus paranthracis]
MRTPSGELHVVDFKTEQIVASIQPIDYWDDKRHWEIKNNIDTLEFHVFDNTRHSSTLMQQNLVLKEVRDGRIVPYVITEIEKNSDDRSVIAYASGEWIQLAKAGIIPPQKLEGKTVIEMVDIALAGTKWKKGNLEYASFRSMTIDEFIDPLSFLKKIASLFELEIQYRAEVVGSQIVGRYVDMVKKRGQETGKEITLGKDLLGIKRIENSQNICTALLGFVKKEGGEFITITEINNGVPYLVDSDAFQRWNEKGQHKFGFYSPETENEDMDSKRLMTLMNTELKKRVNSSVFYEVEAQSIGRVFGLSHELINEGDTIRIKDTGFTPKLYLEARAIVGDESFKNPLQDKYVFGDYHEIIDPNEELRKIYNRILSSLGNKQEMIDQLDKLVQEANETASNAKKESEAAKALAEKAQENIKNNTVDIIEAMNPPTTGLKPFKTLWRDISNGKPGILKIWTGTAWESVVPDVESVKKETLDQVNKDIETTKIELNQKVQEAQNQATGQFNEVQEGLQGVSRTISNIENKQGEIDKKVTKFEQDSSGFKTSIETLTKKDTEISSKLNTVELTVEGTKKTISDVQQTTNDLKKTTTDIKEEAGKISTKLEQVEARTVGGENWLINTGPNEKPQTIGMVGGAQVNKAKFAVQPGEYIVLECSDHTDSFYQFHLDNTKMGDFEKSKDMTLSLDLQNDVHVDFILFQFINGVWSENVQKGVPASNVWKREVWTFNIDTRATGWGLRLRFARNTNSIGKRFRFKKTKLEKGSIPTDFSKSTYELEQSVDGVKTTVTNVQNSQAGFEKRMSNVEQTASGLSSTVSNLNNVVSDQGKKLTEANTKLEQQATAIGAKVELKQVEDYVAGFKIPELKQTVNQNKQDLLDELANKLATEQFNQKMTLIDNRFTINEQGINAAAKKTEVYTRIQADGEFAKDSYVRDMESRLQLTEKGVSISVKENDVIAAINMSKENIKLNAARIDLVGKVNAEWIKAGLLSGCQIRTSNTDNYVSLDDQFIRLYERGVARAFLGHYRRTDGAVQPTFILGSDEKTNAPEGTLFMSQAGAGWPGAYASIGISNGIVDGSVQKSVYWELQRNGLSVLNANDYHVFYAGNGSWYFRRGKPGLYQTSLVVEDNSTDSDLRLPNVTIRNSRAAGYTGVIQLKSSVTQNGWGAVQGNFMTPSLREYKSNIRDISFSALEKIRNLRIRQFNYKNAVNELYRMREEKSPNDPPVTTEDIKTYYGLIVDECDEMFVDESGKGIHLYSYASIAMRALQEVDATVQEQEVEITNLKLQVASQENRIAKLEELLQKLIDQKPEQP